jgi:hypothetical protein
MNERTFMNPGDPSAAMLPSAFDPNQTLPVPAGVAVDRVPAGGAAGARDAILCALAQRFFPGVPVSIQAARIAAHAERYAAAQWPSDRVAGALPPRYHGGPDEYLWAAFKSGAPMPLAKRHLRRILIGVCDSDPDDGER